MGARLDVESAGASGLSVGGEQLDVEHGSAAWRGRWMCVRVDAENAWANGSASGLDVGERFGVE